MKATNSVLLIAAAVTMASCSPGRQYLERAQTAYEAKDYRAAKENVILAKQEYRGASGLAQFFTKQTYKDQVNGLAAAVAASEPTPTPDPRDSYTPTPTPVPTPRPEWKILKGQGCSKVLGITEFIQANPYSVKGNCYYLIGKKLQILGRHQGLYKVGDDSEFVYFLDFGKQDAPNLVFQGVAKGVGPYRYKAVSGAQMTVPSLKVVWSGSYVEPSNR